MSAVVLGVCLIVTTYFVAGFRQGLDADGFLRMTQASTPELLIGVGLIGLIGSLFIVLGWWLTKLSSRQGAFPLLVAGPPVALKFAYQGFSIILAALEPPMNITPFEANSWTYLPNWLGLVGIGASFLFAAVAYTKLAYATRGTSVR
ncbi:hypothetical protein OVA11_09835 [Caulobacter sp. SL161]|uniref:hypothetical protein n=1 Tax=Caulobacter sp. SL161 TaxID=2995156 RepID=UPI0022769613|nr:hypothetical protein [Caulobacter sp. SL161]MCY1647344.1 hypothetical protein [Caulobacter sp. SL161]